MKKNNKGFVLVETLIVSVSVAAIFTIIYLNLYPIVGEYQKVENYDDIDTKYVAHWMRLLVMNKGNGTLWTKVNNNNNKYVTVTKNDCSTYFVNEANCNNFFDGFNVSKMYITSYFTTELKSVVKNAPDIDSSVKEYIEYLPTYEKLNESKKDYKRVIVEVTHDSEGSSDYYKSYATIELNGGSVCTN